MTVRGRSEKALKKIQLLSLIPFHEQIVYLTNDFFLPIHWPSKYDDGEWPPQMGAGADNYLSFYRSIR